LVAGRTVSAIRGQWHRLVPLRQEHLHTLLDAVEHRAALSCERHAALESRERLLEREIAPFQLTDDALEPVENGVDRRCVVCGVPFRGRLGRVRAAGHVAADYTAAGPTDNRCTTGHSAARSPTLAGVTAAR